MKYSNLKYPQLLRILHWTMVAGFVLLFVTGPIMVDLDKQDPLRAPLVLLHKSVGVLALLTVVGRLYVRWRSVLPTFPLVWKPWEKALSTSVHRVMYAGMILVPLTDWATSDLHGRGVKLFGMPLPKIFPTIEGVGTWPGFLHTVVAYTLLGIIGLHLSGVLKHRYVDQACVLKRML